MSTQSVSSAYVPLPQAVPPKLIDQGANEGLAGADVRLISITKQPVTIKGIDSHNTNKLIIGTVQGVIYTQQGPVISIFHKYAYLRKGPTINSAIQLEHYENHVHNRSQRVGGLQCVQTASGYVLHLHINNGLVQLDMRAYRDAEWSTLPHVTMTCNLDWDPSAMDQEILEPTPTDYHDGADARTHITAAVDICKDCGEQRGAASHHVMEHTTNSAKKGGLTNNYGIGIPHVTLYTVATTALHQQHGYPR